MQPHGTRRSYGLGCRCFACRCANAAYTAARRASPPPPPLDASTVRAHLVALRALGVGVWQLHHQTGIARRVIAGVLDGTRARLRPATAARLLQARPVLARGATVPGTKTWRFVDSLERDGYTRRELGWRLGARSQSLQLGARRVRVASALKMARLYQALSQ